jgi:hypothetical protein
VTRPAQCPPDSLTLERPLANTGIAGGVAGPLTVYFEVTNPAVRLHCTLYVYARPAKIGVTGNGGAAHDYTGETWQLYAMSDSTPQEPLNWVFDAAGVNTPHALPESYEFESGVKKIRGAVVLQKNAANGFDTYYVRAVWEPSSGGTEMTDEEQARLFALCELTCNSVVVNLSC